MTDQHGQFAATNQLEKFHRLTAESTLSNNNELADMGFSVRRDWHTNTYETNWRGDGCLFLVSGTVGPYEVVETATLYYASESREWSRYEPTDDQRELILGIAKHAVEPGSPYV